MWSPKALATRKDADGQCIWYGTCIDCDNAYNYAYEGEAMPLGEVDQMSLESVCPELFDQWGTCQIRTCVQLSFIIMLSCLIMIQAPDKSTDFAATPSKLTICSPVLARR